MKNFKHSIDKETYEINLESADKVVSALSRLAFLVRKIITSPKLRRIMAKICEGKGIPFLVPVIDVTTRWNIAFDMITRALKIREEISDTIYAFKDNSQINLLLDDSDYDCLKSLLRVLETLKEITLRVSQSGDAFQIASV